MCVGRIVLQFNVCGYCLNTASHFQYKKKHSLKIMLMKISQRGLLPHCFICPQIINMGDSEKILIHVV